MDLLLTHLFDLIESFCSHITKIQIDGSKSVSNRPLSQHRNIYNSFFIFVLQNNWRRKYTVQNVQDIEKHTCISTKLIHVI